MPVIASQSEAINYIEAEAIDTLGYPSGAVWRDCPVLTSNGADHWVSLSLAVFNDPLRRGVPENCCLGIGRHTGPPDKAFRLLRDSGAWAQIAVGDDEWFWKPQPESDKIDGPHPLAQLPAMLSRERTRLLPLAIMHQKRSRQGYLFDRIFPITQGKLVTVFEGAVRAGWEQLTDDQRLRETALPELCETALRIVCMQVFNHRDVLVSLPDAPITGSRRPAATYADLLQRTKRLPAHLKGLAGYMQGRTGKYGLDVESAVFQALSSNHEYDFACLTSDMLGPFYQAALMRNPATGKLDEEKRKKHGVFYTSRRITQLILDRLPIEEIPPEKRFLLDPTCGSGSFLMAGEQRLAELIRPRRLSNAEKESLASRFIQGNDRDRFAVLVAQLQLVLDKPDADCHYRFKEVEIRFQPSTDASVGVPYFEQPSIIVGNPPFKWERNQEKAASFLQAAATEWLPDGGLLGFVLPATFLSGGGRSRKVRDALVSSCDVLEVWDLPRNILSDEKDGKGGTNGGDIESCVVLLRKRKTSRDVVSFCRLLSVDRSTEARKEFRHSGEFGTHGLCIPATDWTMLPQARWAATPLVPALQRLYAPNQYQRVQDVCRVGNGIKAAPEERVNVKAAPSPEHVPWLQNAEGTQPLSLVAFKPGSISDYIRYPGRMEAPRLKFAKRDSTTGDELPETELRSRGVFAGRKILIQKNADPAAAAPLRAFIDVGHYPSSSFHFAWLDPSLRGSAPWTYEALLAVLNCPVSQACLALARTRNNPTDLIESIPIPRLDYKSVDVITKQVSAILRLDVTDDKARTEARKSLDKEILLLYRLSESERDSFWHAVWGNDSHDFPPAWTDKPWPIHGVVEEIHEADETGPAKIRIRIPGFRRGAQIYDGPIPLGMPGWAMVLGIEFQAEIPASDAEASRFDPLKAQRFRLLPFAYDAPRKEKDQGPVRQGKTS